MHVVDPSISETSTPLSTDHHELEPEPDSCKCKSFSTLDHDEDAVDTSWSIIPVTHPAGHTAQAVVDMLLFCPAEQGSQVVAFVPPRVSVTEPGSHVKQFVRI